VRVGDEYIAGLLFSPTEWSPEVADLFLNGERPDLESLQLHRGPLSLHFYLVPVEELHFRPEVFMLFLYLGRLAIDTYIEC